MANEAVIIELLGEGASKGSPVRFTCATSMEKGTLCKITSPRTIAATAADNDPFAGVLSAETVTGVDTTGTVYQHGIFDLLTGAAVTVGERVSIGGANTVSKVAAADLLFADVGIALETDGGGGDTIAVLVGSGL